MNNLSSFFEYLKTFFITVFFVFIAVIVLLVIIQYQVYENQSTQKPEDEEIDYNLVDVLIDKNKYLELKYPDQYKINLKLGMLYEIKRDFQDSEKEYKTSISKAPYFEYQPKHKLALLYLKENKLDEAQALMDNIQEQPDVKLIKYKADIYQKLGDKYYNMGDYENAISKYRKSLVYWKILKKEKEINYINNSLASAYVYIAEVYLDKMRPDDAINSLEIALSIVKSPLIEYKLGLLLKDENPELAYKYFEDVFEKAPEIINYDDYYKLLSNLAENASLQGDEAQAALYNFKIKKIKKYYKTNVLSVTDLKLVDLYGTIKKNWLGQSNIYLEGRIKNTSKEDFSSLFMEIIFKYDNQIVGDYTQQIVDSKSVLQVGSYTPLISIKIKDKQPKKEDLSEGITAEIYLSKTDKSYKLLLNTIKLKEQVKKKHHNKFLSNLIRKITSKLPAFLF